MFKKTLLKINGLILASAILTITLLVTLFVLFYINTIIKKNIAGQFQNKIKDIKYTLEANINTYNNILYAFQGLFAANNFQERQNWAPFAKAVRIDKYPDIGFVSFVKIIQNKDKDIFISEFKNDKSTRAQGYPDFKIYPEGSRNEYAVVSYAYPESDSSLKAYGFDLYSEPVRNSALKFARDSNTLVASEKISIIPDQSTGFIITVPVYRNGAPVNTVEERRSAILGYINAVFRINKLFTAQIFNIKEHPSDVAFAIYDTTKGASLNRDHFIYANDNGRFTNSLTYRAEFSQTGALTLDGRTWTVKFISKPEFGYSYSHLALPWVVGLGGISFSFLLSLIFYQQIKIAQEKLLISETSYQRLFESAQDGILILDFSSKLIIDANPVIEKLLGFSKKELINKDLLKTGIFPEEDINNCFTKLAKDGFAHREINLQTKSGLSIDTEIICNIYNIGHKRVVHFNIRDIRKRKKAERLMKINNIELKKLNKIQETTKKAMLKIMDHLEKAKTKLEMEKSKAQAMLTSIGDGLIATDQKGKVIITNKSAEDLLQFNPGEMIGKEFSQVCPIENAAGHKIPGTRPLEKILVSGQTINTAHYYYLKRDKTKFPVTLTVTPINLNSRIIGAINVFRDITKEKEIDQAKTEFVSLASHQLRSPLSTIHWYLNSILAGDLGKLTPKQESYLEEINKSNKRMIFLVNSLLNVSRIEMGILSIKPSLNNLAKLANNTLDDLNAKIKEKKLQIEKHYDSLPLISIDAKIMLIIFQNLLSNAITYTPNKGKIIILIKKDGHDALITVSDNGYGIPKKQQTKIFTKLFRADNAKEIDTAGSGLGLYLTKSIIERIGGKIWFESEENKGSNFYVKIPLSGMKKN